MEENKIKKLVYMYLDLYFDEAKYSSKIKLEDSSTYWEGYVIKDKGLGKDVMLIGRPLIKEEINIWYYDGTYMMDPEVILDIESSDFKKIFVSYMKDKFNKKIDSIL